MGQKVSMKLIFTHRPPSKKVISFVNLVTRNVTKCPYDHVALYHNGYVYESTAGIGVHSIPFSEWKKGREGSWLHLFKVDDDRIDLSIFEQHRGKPYDFKANVLWLTKQPEKLKKNADKAIYCSELIGLMAKAADFYEWTPARCAKEFIDSEIELVIL
jgi:uncharacterized protein YycO